MSLAAPFHARAADPAVKNFPVGKLDDVTQLVNEFGKLEIGFGSFQFVADLVGDRNQNTIIVRGRRHGKQDQALAILQPLDNFLCGLLAAKFCKTLFDVLDLERSRLESVLTDDVLHSVKYSSGLRLEPFIKDGHVACRKCEVDCGAETCGDLQLYFLTSPGNLFNISDI